jgi:hypothetical protein
MADIPQAAIAAGVAAVLADPDLVERGYSFEAEELVTTVLEAAAPRLREAWLATVIGYRTDIDGRVYHPADVTIIRRAG